MTTAHTESLAETLDELDDDSVVAIPSENDTETVVAVVPDEVETELAKDTLFELLKNQRRRDALEYLKANDGWSTLSDMAEHIAAKENDIPLGALTSKQRKRVYIGLYQCHLPKMANAGVVDFDKNRGTIKLEALAAQLDPYLDADTDGEAAEETTAADPARRTALAPESVVFAVVGAGALGGAVGVPGLDALAVTGWAAISGLTLLAAAALPSLRD